MIQLREYQVDVVKRASDTLKRHGIVFLTGEERSGKTLPALTVVKEAGYKSALCVTTIKASPDIVSAFNASQYPFRLEVINYESFHKVTNTSPDVIILDESHKLSKFPTPSVRAKRIKEFSQGKPIIYLTATPSAEGFYKIYPQMWVSSFSPLARWRNAYDFIRDFVTVRKEKRNGIEHPVYEKTDMVRLWPLIKHLFIAWTREDAGFAVEPTEHILTIKMSRECVDLTRKLKKDKIHIDQNGNAAIINGGAQLISKLHQIGSGTLKYDETVYGTIDIDGVVIDASKAEFIRSYFFGKKIVIFYQYVAEGKLLRKFFPNHTDSPQDFNDRNDLVFIAQVKTACEGISLHTADALVYYNLPFSATVWLQSRARLLSLDRTKPADVYIIASEHGIERKIYNALSNKMNFTWSFYANKHTGVNHPIQIN